VNAATPTRAPAGRSLAARPTGPRTSAGTSTKPDQAALDAVELARAAAEETAGADQVGEHLGFDVEGDRVVTHYFASAAPGYVGWRWSVTLARASRARMVTVDEVVLLPGAEAVLAPAWVPWSERLRPGDLGPGDLLPTPEDDPRLVPGYTGADEGVPTPLDVAAVVFELGLGRERVLSVDGRDEAAERWYAGAGGPDAPIALAAPGLCATCAFSIPLRGPLSQLFGVCANEMSPSDAQVVSLDHGCGAHSSVLVPPPAGERGETVLDTLGADSVPSFRVEEPGHV